MRFNNKKTGSSLDEVFCSFFKKEVFQAKQEDENKI